MSNSPARSVQSAKLRVIVDGYNVLHAWSEKSRGGPADFGDAARAGLIETLRTIRDVEQAHITIVFDGPRETSTPDPAESGSDVDVIYASAGLTADGVIGRIITSANDPHHCVVVTGDRLVCETALATGATTQSPRELAAWVERCRARAIRAARQQSRAANDGFSNKLPL